MHTEKSICAVVVTFNRKALLVNCLNALKAQTHPLTHIVVIDNASTDGTADFLGEHGWTNNDAFTLLTLSENMGGAGGFHEGIKYAFEQGFDYIWLMDDDGFPAETCLEKLLPYISNNCYIGPIVIDCEGKEKLSFSLRLPNSLQVIDHYSDIPKPLKIDNQIKDTVLPFNGTLIGRDLVQQMGLPMREYFIWGDEREYTMRAEAYHANILTVIDALFYHPIASSISEPMFFGKLRFNNAHSDLKQYCFCRNTIATFAKHKGFIYALAFFVKTTWFYAFTQPSLSRLLFAWHAMWHGLTNDFSHHKDYLK